MDIAVLNVIQNGPKVERLYLSLISWLPNVHQINQFFLIPPISEEAMLLITVFPTVIKLPIA